MKMHNRLATAFAAVAAFVAMAPLQAQDVRVIARVPFEFKVGSTSLPRDTYRISHLNGRPEMLLLRSDRKGVFVRAQEARMPRNDQNPVLTFHRYGDEYFLREIRMRGTTRLDLPETNAERDAAERRTDRLATRMETVTVVAEHR